MSGIENQSEDLEENIKQLASILIPTDLLGKWLSLLTHRKSFVVIVCYLHCLMPFIYYICR